MRCGHLDNDGVAVSGATEKAPRPSSAARAGKGQHEGAEDSGDDDSLSIDSDEVFAAYADKRLRDVVSAAVAGEQPVRPPRDVSSAARRVRTSRGDEGAVESRVVSVLDEVREILVILQVGDLVLLFIDSYAENALNCRTAR